MQASLITVTYNSADDLRQFWANAQELDAEWVVVDNASVDGSADVARSLGAKVIDLPANVGFSTANNHGARSAGSDVLIFVNPDVEVTQHGVDQIVERLRVSGGVVAPQLVNQDGSLQENGRAMPYPHRKIAHMFWPDSGVSRHYSKVARQGETVAVPWVMGAALAMSRTDFERIGGWNERYFVYYEDADICLRSWRLGIEVHLMGAVNWVHGWARETSRSLSWQIWKFEFVSAFKFYSTHPSSVIPWGKFSRKMKEIERRPVGETV